MKHPPTRATSMNLEPILPPELERAIVRIAAEDIRFPLAGHHTCINIQLTARRFYDWILPFLFRILDKKNFSTHLHRMGPRFIDNLRYLGKNTTHLAYTIDPAVKNDLVRLQLLIECCPNLVDLAVWHTSDTLLGIHETVSKLSSLKRLSAHFEGLQNDQIRSQTYMRLTHLDLLGGIDADTIQVFQNLTHLCINGVDPFWRNLLDRVTDKQFGCPLLRVMISICEPEGIVEYEDKRHVVLLEGPYYDTNWLNGAHGGVDAWEFGERIVIARQKGYLLKPSRQAFRMLYFYFHKELSPEGQAWWKYRDRGFTPGVCSSDDEVYESDTGSSETSD